jgi:hypothetical protein
LCLFPRQCHLREEAARRIYDERGSVIPIPTDNPGRTVVAGGGVEPGFSVHAIESLFVGAGFTILYSCPDRLENRVAELGVTLAVVELSGLLFPAA